jgi:repressor LexA
MSDETQSTTATVYEFLCVYIAAHGYAPSLREIAAGCFIGRSSVTHHLDRLEVSGKLVRDPGQARSIRLIAEPPKTGQMSGQMSNLS